MPNSKDQTFQNQTDGWNAEELVEEASQKSGDEIRREIKRGNEAEGDADERDHAGASDSKDTPQGREEAKTETENKDHDR